jgi:Putative Actinobacterial Holin-X, holin superfamily III
MAAEQNDEQVLHRLFDQINQHIETRWEYFTLTSTEKISGLAANFAGAVIVLFFALLVLFFFTLGLAWWLGDCIGNRAGGFALTALIFIPIALVLYRWIRPFVRTKIIQSMLHDDGAENPITHE